MNITVGLRRRLLGADRRHLERLAVRGVALRPLDAELDCARVRGARGLLAARDQRQ